MEKLFYSKLFFAFFCMFFSLGIHSQILYISPYPNSQYNNPKTNIIIKLDSEILNADELSEIFQIRGINGKIYPYHFKLVDKDKTILFKTDVQFEDFDTIEIKLLDTLFLHGKTLASLEYKFKVSNQLKEELVVNKQDLVEFEDHSSTIPPNFPSINITINNNPANGKIFFYNTTALASDNDRYLAIIDNNGIPEYWRQENNAGLNFTLQPSGYLSFWNHNSFVLMDSNYNITETIACGNGYTTDFHEFIHLPNKHSFLFAYDMQIIDMSQIIPGGYPSANVTGIVIQELDEYENIVFQWRSFDHFQITDAVDVDLKNSTISYVHGNGLAIDTDGNILLSSRLLNEITKINRTTGDIMWRLGGKNNQFSFINDPEMFCRQHHIQVLKNGNITIFDNGTCHSPQITTVKEYKLDIENKTAELVWSFHHPNGMYSNTMGSAQRLDNGNTFINWGMIENTSLPSITEVKPDGTIVFELNFNNQFQLLYRSFRYVWDNKIFTSIDKVDDKNEYFKIFPNPASESLNILIDKRFSSDGSIAINDIKGNVVYKQNLTSIIQNNEVSIPIENLRDGLYFITITNNVNSKTKMFIKMDKN